VTPGEIHPEPLFCIELWKEGSRPDSGAEEDEAQRKRVAGAWLPLVSAKKGKVSGGGG
jgi:hypothetical protein